MRENGSRGEATGRGTLRTPGRRIGRVEAPFPHVEGVEHRFVRVGGVRLHVAEAGSGPPVLMLHGWPQHWYCWRHVIPALAETHRVICPDLRGFGWSDAPPGSYEKETLATDVLRLVDELGLEAVRLVGHDWGGFVGFLMCLRAPERVERYLALDIIHPWPVAAGFDLRATLAASYQPLLSLPIVGEWTLRSQSFLVTNLIRLGSLRREGSSDGDLAAFADRLREPARARATSALYRTFLTRELPGLLRGRYRDRRLTVPTLLLSGAGDPVVTPDRLRGYEEHADDMDLEIVPGAGHFLPEERPELVLERMRSFLLS